MFRHIKVSIVWILVVSMTLSGCAGMQGGGKASQTLKGVACMAGYTLAGAAAGAAVGAAGGVIVNSKDRKEGAKTGAAIGAAGGALIGVAYAWGKCLSYFSYVKSEPIMDYNGTVKAVNYNPKKGFELKLNNGKATPSFIAPGETLKIDIDYSLLPPTDQKDLKIIETRILKVVDPVTKKYQDCNPDTPQYDDCGEVSEEITAESGLRKANGEFPIPSNTVEGEYVIEFVVTAGGKQDSASIPVTVTNKRELLARAETFTWGKTINVASGKTDASASGVKAVSEEKTVTVTDVKATFRKYPSKKAHSFGVAKTGDVLPFIKEDTVDGKKWYQIRMENGEPAWIVANTSKLSGESTSSSDEKMTEEGTTVTITAGTATLRKYPDTKSDKLGTANKGDTFLLVKQDTSAGKEWYEVRLANGETAWILASTAKLSEE